MLVIFKLNVNGNGNVFSMSKRQLNELLFSAHLT